MKAAQITNTEIGDGVIHRRILTMCRQGLVRSVALADVLKMHFRPVDVMSIGHFANTPATIEMMCCWADRIVVMEEHYKKHVPAEFHYKVLICDVGPDVDNPQGSKTPKLIKKCWDWVRLFKTELGGIQEHQERL